MAMMKRSRIPHEKSPGLTTRPGDFPLMISLPYEIGEAMHALIR